MEGLKKILIPALILFFLSGAAAAATLNVGPGQTYTKIQSAVDAANSGDTIIVDEGTYFEHVKISKNGLTLKGRNKDKTILDGNKSGTVILLEKATNVKISDLTVQRSGGSGHWDAGITLLSSNNNEITNVIASKNYDGISLYQFSSNNTIRYNSANSNSNHGIFLFSSMDNVVTNNNALNNKIGIYLDSSRNNRIYSNNIAGNKEASAFDNSGLNSWDDGRIGNYWDDYSGTGPYSILGANAKDNNPLRNPVFIPGQPQVSAVVTPKAGKPAPGFSIILVAAGLFAAYLMSFYLRRS